jgi:hypothetical protein
MGRRFEDDPVFFEAAAAAGVVAAQMGEAASEQAFSDFYATIAEGKLSRTDEPDDPDCAPSACGACPLDCPSAPVSTPESDGVSDVDTGAASHPSDRP